MFRLLGFIVGSIASIALLFMLVGIPSIRPAEEATKSGRFDLVIQQLKDKQRMANEAAEAAEAAESTQPAGNVETEAEQPTATPIDDATGAVAASGAVSEIDPPPAAPTQTAAETGWQPFWNPFRSEIAARGFVRRLENVTGLDYRVVRKKTGVYEVAFSYDDDDERRIKLSQIAAATGLDLSDADR